MFSILIIWVDIWVLDVLITGSEVIRVKYTVRAWASWHIATLYLLNLFFLPYFAVFFWPLKLYLLTIMSCVLWPVCEICFFCHWNGNVLTGVSSILLPIVNLIDYLCCSLVKKREGWEPEVTSHIHAHASSSSPPGPFFFFSWILFCLNLKN